MRPNRENLRLSLNRLLTLAKTLRRNEPFNATGFAEAYGLERKTIMRDLRVLRQHGWKIEFDPCENTYVLRSAPPPTLL